MKFFILLVLFYSEVFGQCLIGDYKYTLLTDNLTDKIELLVEKCSNNQCITLNKTEIKIPNELKSIPTLVGPSLLCDNNNVTLSIAFGTRQVREIKVYLKFNGNKIVIDEIISASVDIENFTTYKTKLDFNLKSMIFIYDNKKLKEASLIVVPTIISDFTEITKNLKLWENELVKIKEDISLKFYKWEDSLLVGIKGNVRSIAFCDTPFFIQNLNRKITVNKIQLIKDCLILPLSNPIGKIYELSIYKFSLEKIINENRFVLMILPKSKVDKNKISMLDYSIFGIFLANNTSNEVVFDGEIFLLPSGF